MKNKISQKLCWALGPWIVLLLAAPLLQAQSLERANELIGEESFEEAAAMFRALTEADGDNGAAWYGLARALHEGGHAKDAVAAYEKTLELGENPGRTLYHFARLSASSGDKTRALALLRKAQQGGLAPYQVVMQTAEFAALLDDPTFQEIARAMQPCTAPEYAHFDFWLGEWDVETPSGQPAGQNRITRIHGGCALLEEWTSAGGGTGSSFNTYNTTKGTWQQFWVDAQGTVLEIQGGLEGKAMVMVSDPEVSPRYRITWTPRDDGSVRQHWESSSDDGASWTTAFDGIYRKKK